MFTIFIIIAVWQLSLPLWLQVCITAFGIFHTILNIVKLILISVYADDIYIKG